MSDRTTRPTPSWSDLPTELLDRIATRLDTETDARRFRAVCATWHRASMTPFKKLLRLPLKLPVPTGRPVHVGAYLVLTERIVYLVHSPDNENPSSWLVKVESTNDAKLRVLSPVSDRRINIMPKTVNTLGFRVHEIRRYHVLRYVNPRKSNKKKFNDHEYGYGRKVVVSPASNDDDYVIAVIDDQYKMWYIKSGDPSWTMYTSKYWSNSFLDVVYYKDQFYGITEHGKTLVFDSMFDATDIRYSPSRVASKRHLIELYDGELYLVEGVTDKDKRVCKCYDIDDGCQCRWPTRVKNTVEEIVISRLNERRQWVEEKGVNDRVIFVGEDCSFALSTKGIEGCNRARVFYADRFIFFRTEEEKVVYAHEILEYEYEYEEDSDDDYNYYECDCCVSSDPKDEFQPSEDIKVRFRGLHGHNIGVCDFESGKLGSLMKFPEYADVFWPPPAWLDGAN